MSTASRVVPGNSLDNRAGVAQDRVDYSDDFPAFGLPTIASERGEFRFSILDFRLAIRATNEFNRFKANVEMPRPCAALMGMEWSNPSCANPIRDLSCLS